MDPTCKGSSDGKHYVDGIHTGKCIYCGQK